MINYSRRSLYIGTLSAIFNLSLFSQICAAQSTDGPPSPAPLPSTVAMIPGANESGEGSNTKGSNSSQGKLGGIILNRNNESGFKDILIAPLAAWLKDGRAVIRVVRNFESAFGYGAKWIDASEKNQLEFDLAPDFSLVRKAAEPPVPGWPFGTAVDLGREPDLQKKAYKLLWNVAYSLLTVRDQVLNVELAWVGTQTKLRGASALLYSKASLLGEQVVAEKQSQLMRQDLFKVLSPAAVSGYTRFSQRDFGAADDRLWTFSPILGRLREELPSNRTDGILGSSVSFDDLGVWAGKTQAVSARVVDEKVLVVPFPATTFHRLDTASAAEVPAPTMQESTKSGSDQEQLAKTKTIPAAKAEAILTAKGFHRRSDGSSAMVTWNHETRQFAQFAPWVPTSVVFIPRQVIILEVESLDPYSGIGRQYLFIDKELQLPVYKLVYDRVGDFKKTVVGGWGMGQSKDGQTRFPFLAFLLVVDQSNQSVSTLTTTQVQTFLGRDTARARELQSWLSPAKYPKPKKEADAPASSPPVEEKVSTPKVAPADDEVSEGAEEEEEDEEEQEDSTAGGY